MILEHSLNGIDFEAVYDVATIGLPFYQQVHYAKEQGLHYFRVLCELQSGAALHSNVIVLSNSDGVEKIEAFPNPTQGPATVRFTTATAGAEIMTIYNSLGQLIQQNRLQLAAGLNEMQINLSRLKSDVYFIKIRNSTYKIEKLN